MKKIIFLITSFFLFNLCGKVLSNENPTFFEFLNKFADEMQKQGGGTYKNNNQWGNQSVNINCDSNGNLKIIEDLCWDKFSTINAWKKKFPNCKVSKGYENSFEVNYYLHPYTSESRSDTCYVKINNREIKLNLLEFEKSSSYPGGTILKELDFNYADSSMARSSTRYIKNQFTYNFSKSMKTGASYVYCNKFSCFAIWDDGGISTITPSEYTTSIIDNKQIDSNMF